MALTKKEKIDNFIVFAVFFQSVLIILQAILIDVFRMESDATTIYRVVLSAIPMSIAILLSFIRKPAMFIGVYGVSVLILLLNVVIFPENSEYLIRESTRFLLPMVISSALCLITVKNIDLIEKVWYYVSWLVFLEVAFYAIEYFRGTFVILNYNMSFSYGCLLPMVALYRKKKIYSIIASIFLFLVVLSIGSRGAAIIFVIYLFFDIMQNNKKLILPMIILVSVIFTCIPIFVSYLEAIGISSRTLVHFTSGKMFRYDDRESLNDISIDAIINNPLGVGLWGDRIVLKGEGAYAHNIIIEMLLNWGGVLGFIIIIGFVVKFIQLYLHSNKINKNRLVVYLLVCIGPLMASSSYLVSPGFGIFCGLFYLLSTQNTKPRIQTKFPPSCKSY